MERGQQELPDSKHLDHLSFTDNYPKIEKIQIQHPDLSIQNVLSPDYQEKLPSKLTRTELFARVFSEQDPKLHH